MTTKAWAVKAFEILVWQVTFMNEGPAKSRILAFLLEAPDEVKRLAQGKIPGL